MLIIIQIIKIIINLYVTSRNIFIHDPVIFIGYQNKHEKYSIIAHNNIRMEVIVPPYWSIIMIISDAVIH